MIYMVFDVESVGLHGEGFAVGYVVIDKTGKRLAEDLYACDRKKCIGTADGNEWIANNVPTLSVTHSSPVIMRDEFWRDWMRWKSAGAMLAADVPWPVEARFLAACIDDARPGILGGMANSEREWDGPYPLIDVASVRMAKGINPTDSSDRLNDEKQVHNPLCDARQSARLLIEALSL